MAFSTFQLSLFNFSGGTIVNPITSSGSYIIPAGIRYLYASVTGAPGQNQSLESTGGRGANITTYVSLSGITSIYVTVNAGGGSGGGSSGGGFGGFGGGYSGIFTGNSAIQTNSIVIAGGGGGACSLVQNDVDINGVKYNFKTSTNGGDAGTLSTNASSSSGVVKYTSSVSAGSGPYNGNGTGDGATSSSGGNSGGTVLRGGNAIPDNNPGAGGGGGYYGGGGSSGPAAGGGGSSFVSSNCFGYSSSLSTSTASVIIYYIR